MPLWSFSDRPWRKRTISCYAIAFPTQGRRTSAMSGGSWLRIGAFAAFLAVAFGAFGAHGLSDRLKPLSSDSNAEAAFKLRRLENFETASRYNMYHALGLIVVGLIASSGHSGTVLTVAGWSF